MKKIWFLLVPLLFFACEKNSTTEEFSTINVTGDADVQLLYGETFSFTTDDDNNSIYIKDGVLYIQGDVDVKVYVPDYTKITQIIADSSADITGGTQDTLIFENVAIKAYGSSDIELNMKANDLNIDAKDGSDLKLHGTTYTLTANFDNDADLGGDSDNNDIDENPLIVLGGNVDISLNNDCDVYLSGKAGTVNLTASDDANYYGFGLIADTYNLTLQDDCDAEIYATNSITGTIKDDVNVIYKGEPQVTVSVSDNATIQPYSGK